MDVSRILAVAVADARTRLRRSSTGVLVLASAVLAWLAIPDPSTGAGLLNIGGARALYTSSALAFATSLLLAVPFSLFGFFLVSNGLERDLRTRMATVVAATPVGNAEYLLGKLAGNVALLVVVAGGSLAAAMATQVLRGEGPLEPVTYVASYALVLAPGIAWVAVIALLFECAPALSGRGGDVLYVFVWMILLPLGAEPWRTAGVPISPLGHCLDYAGLGIAISRVQQLVGHSSFQIGYGAAVTKPPVRFPGFAFTLDAIGARALGFVLPVLLFPLALALFHRFDPARTKSRRAASRRSLSAVVGAVARPIGRPLLALLARVSPDAALTFRAHPSLVIVAAIPAVLGLTLPLASVRQFLLPAVFAVLSGVLADVATRERRAGFTAIVFATPRGRDGFALWKLGTAALVAGLFAGVPTVRLLMTEPRAGVSAFIGVLFLAAAAVFLGIATGTPKTFLSLSLALWYVALNAKGHAPALDYGGWWAMATPGIQVGWTAATVLTGTAALIAHRLRLAREG
jgi:hypothetical protein